MPDLPAPRTLEVRHLQLARAVLAAIAAVMVAFTADHSAALGLAVFSGWAMTTGVVELLAVWLVRRTGATRWPLALLGALTLLAGMAGGIVALRSTLTFFVVVIAWSLASGVLELAVSWRAAAGARRAGARVAASDRDGIVVGVVTVLLGLGLLTIPEGYRLDYTIAAAGQSFTLTGIAIAVGVFGGYAAVVAVYLGIAGLSPRRAEAEVVPDAAVGPDGETSDAVTAADSGLRAETADADERRGASASGARTVRAGGAS